MQAWLNKHQVAIFFLLTLLIGWSPWYLGGSGFIPGAVSISGLILIFAVGGKTGLIAALKKTMRCKAGFYWFLIPLCLPALLDLVQIGINLLLGGKPPAFTFIRTQWYLIPLFMLHNLHPLGGPVGEEIFGFRGFALPRLQDKYGTLIASIIIGAFFGFWHLPEFLRPGSSQYAMGFAYYGPFILLEIGWSILMAWVYNRTNESVLAGGIFFHLMFNTTDCLLLTNFTMNTLNRFPAIDRRLLYLHCLVTVVAAAAVAIKTKGQLGRKKVAVPNPSQASARSLPIG